MDSVLQEPLTKAAGHGGGLLRRQTLPRAPDQGGEWLRRQTQVFPGEHAEEAIKPGS